MRIPLPGLGPVVVAVVGLVGLSVLDSRAPSERTVRVNGFTASAQERVALAWTGDGELLATWESRRQRGGLPAAMLRRLRADEASAEVALDPAARGAEAAPVVAHGGGRSWAAWEAVTERGTAIRLRQLASETVVTVDPGGDGSAPALAVDARGRAVVGWRSAMGARFALFGCDGAALASWAPAESAATVAVAAVGDGLQVAWATLAAADAVGAVRGQRLDGALQPRGPVRTLGAGVEPALAAAGGGAAVAWMRAVAGGYEVCCRRLDGAGAPQAAEQVLARPAPGAHLTGATVAAAADGELAVAYAEVAAIGDASTVKLRRYDGTAWSDAIAVPGVAALRTGGGSLAFGPSGELAVAWAGDAGLGDDSAAHVTVLGAGVALAAPRDGEPSGAGVAAAEPHDPPTYSPVQPDQGSAQRPQANGPDFGFAGIDNTGWTPPDPHVAVGPAHVIATTNGGLAFFDKGGVRSFFQTISDSGGFWGAQGATRFVFDPEVFWDPWASRFVAFACERNPSNGSGSSYFLIAVSDDADPNGTWHKYRIDVTALANTGTGGGDIDSPNLGLDAQAFYLTADFFRGGQKYLVLMLDKTPLLAGQAVGTQRSLLIQGSQSHGIPVMWSAGQAMFLIEHFESTSNSTVRLHAIRNPLTTPSRVTFDLPVPPYGRPGSATQAGTSQTITLFDARFWSCTFRGGSLWACHHHGSPARSRWYEIDMGQWPTSGTPRLVQSGDEQMAGTHLYFNSISVNAGGDAMMTFARSSPSEFISIARCYRRAGDPLGSMRPQVLVRTNTTPYPNSRWGDYSAVAADPADASVLWYTHEAATSSSAWQTWIGRRATSDWLEASPTTVSMATGGVVNFAIEAPPQHAGQAYLVLAGFSGTVPGFNLGSVHVPLNFDALTGAVLSSLPSPVFGGFLGQLNASSCASAALQMPPIPALAGRTLSFAAVVWNAGTWQFATNAADVSLVP